MAKYCANCGAELNEQQDVCLKCGIQLNINKNNGGKIFSDKSKTTAGLFGIFLGWIGVHNFYLGNIGIAVAQLLISVLSCGLLAIVSAIWGLIEGIMILSGSINTDANGNLLRD